jgi:hypothetical protein
MNRARTTGSRQKTSWWCRPHGSTPDAEEVELKSFPDDGTKSVRNVTDILNLSKSTVQRTLKDNHMQAYHYTKVQHLLPEDHVPRLKFYNRLLQGAHFEHLL